MADKADTERTLRQMRDGGAVIFAGTGHRQPRLGISYSPGDFDFLCKFVRAELVKLHDCQPIDVCISGGATGFDQAFATAALDLNILLCVAQPFVGQEKKWPPEGRRLYHDILSRAWKVVTVCEGPYSGKHFYTRDTWMVAHATDVLSLLDNSPEKSGTGITVSYARKRNVPVTPLWDAWEEYRARPLPV